MSGNLASYIWLSANIFYKFNAYKKWVQWPASFAYHIKVRIKSLYATGETHNNEVLNAKRDEV